MSTHPANERAAWPDPPHFWKNYTDENLLSRSQPTPSKGNDNGSDIETDSLREGCGSGGGYGGGVSDGGRGVYLDPPRASETWKAFGFEYDVCVSLSFEKRMFV